MRRHASRSLGRAACSDEQNKNSGEWTKPVLAKKQPLHVSPACAWPLVGGSSSPTHHPERVPVIAHHTQEGRKACPRSRPRRTTLCEPNTPGSREICRRHHTSRARGALAPRSLRSSFEDEQVKEAISGRLSRHMERPVVAPWGLKTPPICKAVSLRRRPKETCRWSSSLVAAPWRPPRCYAQTPKPSTGRIGND